MYVRFNRINPNISIPTAARLNWPCISINAFQSYQSKQFNPDYKDFANQHMKTEKGFNRINPNRSIPTAS